jgi:hypothetical protein
MWLLIAGGAVVGAWLVRRMLRTRDDPDFGTVSTEWLTTHRAGRRSIEP